MSSPDQLLEPHQPNDWQSSGPAPRVDSLPADVEVIVLRLARFLPEREGARMGLRTFAILLLCGGLFAFVALGILNPGRMLIAVPFILTALYLEHQTRRRPSPPWLMPTDQRGAELLRAAPELRAKFTPRRLRNWISALAREREGALLIRICNTDRPQRIRPLAIPFEPFSFSNRPEWLHEYEDDLSHGVTGETPENATFDITPPPPPIRGLRRRLKNLAGRLSGLFTLFLVVALPLAFAGWVVYELVRIGIDAVVSGRAPRIPTPVYAVSAAIGGVLLYAHLINHRQWWVVPGGAVRRTTVPWRRDWKIKLFKRAECVLCLNETGEALDSWIARGDSIHAIDVSTIGATDFAATWLSPVPPPEEAALRDLA